MDLNGPLRLSVTEPIQHFEIYLLLEKTKKTHLITILLPIMHTIIPLLKSISRYFVMVACKKKGGDNLHQSNQLVISIGHLLINFIIMQPALRTPILLNAFTVGRECAKEVVASGICLHR
jgi:hypothetical protein